MIRRTLPLLPLLLLSLLAVPATAEAQARPATLAGRSTVYAPNGAAATSHPLASTAALGILQAGGNAVDAAVAAAAVLNVVEPHMTGIGGDMFAILWVAEEGRLVGLDASGRSGSGMTPEVLEGEEEGRIPYRGPRSVTVPGALSGWAALVERYGSLDLAEVLQPAIDLAENGFPVSPIIASQWADNVDVLRRDAGATATYLLDGDRAPRAGEWFTNPGMASSFRTIAREGPGAFYGGALGRRIVDHLRGLGGFVTLEDLRNHGVRWVDPISADYKGYTVWELPPAGQGVAALEMLEIAEGLELKAMGHNSAAYLHHLIEAKKLAFADLARYVADPDHMRVGSADLLAPDFVRSRRQLIDPWRAGEAVEPGALVTESETIYLSVSDRDGNMVSFINSVYEYFGSGVVVPGTGFALQNRAAGFTMEAGHPNRVGPGKRPLHTIIPGFVTRHGEPWMAFGLMGGSMQPQGHVQFLLNLFEFDMDLQEAIDAARFRHLSGRRVAIEGVGEEVRAALRAMGHDVVDESGVAFGGAQAIIRLDRGWAAGSDPRKDGMAIGH